jgi:hypothetical protein
VLMSFGHHHTGESLAPASRPTPMLSISKKWRE